MMGAAFMPDSSISPDEMVSHDSSSSIEALKNWGKKCYLTLQEALTLYSY